MASAEPEHPKNNIKMLKKPSIKLAIAILFHCFCPGVAQDDDPVPGTACCTTLTCPWRVPPIPPDPIVTITFRLPAVPMDTGMVGMADCHETGPLATGAGNPCACKPYIYCPNHACATRCSLSFTTTTLSGLFIAS